MSEINIKTIIEVHNFINTSNGLNKYIINELLEAVETERRSRLVYYRLNIFQTATKSDLLQTQPMHIQMPNAFYFLLFFYIHFLGISSRQHFDFAI